MIRVLMIAAICVASCTASASQSAETTSKLATAEAFIAAFYSFDRARLDAAMADAAGSKPDILYYQGWAEGGNYVVVKRHPCRFDKPDEVSCGVTVRDDLITPALGIDFDVTDTFHFAFVDGRIVKVWNSSDDPPEYHQAMKWLRQARPEIFSGPCLGIWEGGPTPKDCVRAIAKGFAEFRARN